MKKIKFIKNTIRLICFVTAGFLVTGTGCTSARNIAEYDKGYSDNSTTVKVPDKPVEPTKPIEPTKPMGVTAPDAVKKPSDVVKVTDVESVKEPVKPTEIIKSDNKIVIEPVKPVESVKPVTAVKPVSPSDAAAPVVPSISRTVTDNKSSEGNETPNDKINNN